MVLATGDVLQNRYHIGARLGQGGMGAVYRGYDTRLDVPVAIKEMVPQPGLAGPDLDRMREQFRQEARVLARLRHPHLVRVSDFFVEGDNVYLVMDFVTGEDLAVRIARDGALPESQVLVWAQELLDALATCHDQGVIHRDIKPQNVIINTQGQAILVDFGLVKLWDASDPVTQTAVRGMGTLEYAPPEQYSAAAGHTDPRSDLYSLGSTLYHALTGQAPPTATDRMADPDRFLPVRRLNPGVTPETEAAILRAMSLPRAERFPDARAMADALRAPMPALHPGASEAQRPVPAAPPPPAATQAEAGASEPHHGSEVTVFWTRGAGEVSPKRVVPGRDVQKPVASAPPAAPAYTPPASQAAAVKPRRRWGLFLALALVGVALIVTAIFVIPDLVMQMPATEVLPEKEQPVVAPVRNVIVVATTPDMVPMSFINPQGQLVGYDIDLMRLIAERAGFEVKFIQVSWDHIFEGLDAGEFDAAISAITINDERQAHFAFSDPYFNAGQVIVVPAGSPVRRPVDLRGGVIGAQAGTEGERIVAEIGEVDMRLYDNPEAAFIDLDEGRLDAVICDLLSASRLVFERRGAGTRLQVITDPLTEEWLGIMLQKDNLDLLLRINEGLAQVRGDEPLLRELAERWLP